MKRKLLCWVSPFNAHVVIAPAARVAQFDAIHRAATWGQFASADPKTYESLCEAWVEEGEDLPRSDEPFDISMVPGYEEGDYPPWLQAEMGLYVPMEILQENACLESSVINGQFWILESKALPAVIEELRAKGIEIEQTDQRPYE